MSLLFSVIVCVVLSYIWPQNYDFTQMRIATDRHIVAEDQKDPVDFSGEECEQADCDRLGGATHREVQRRLTCNKQNALV